MRTGLLSAAFAVMLWNVVSAQEIRPGDSLGLESPAPDRVLRVKLDASGLDLTRNQVLGERITQGEIDWFRGRLRRGDGGGGDIEAGSLQVIQTDFVESNCPPDCDGMGTTCNIVLLLWDETEFNPDGVDIIIDGVPVGNIAGVAEQDLPNTNGVFVPIEAGMHTFRVEEGNTGTSDELSFEVLDNQPMGDSQDVQCAQGNLEDGGTCEMQVCWSNGGPRPSNYTILIDGALLGALAAPGQFFLRTVLTITGVPPAKGYAVTVINFLESDDPRGLYRGCFNTVEGCEITCEEPDCRPLYHPYVLQTEYGTTIDDNEILALWLLGNVGPNGETAPYDVGINLFDLGELVTQTPLPGDLIGLFLNAVPGEHELGLQGICAEGIESEITTRPFVLREESPVTSPVVDGEIALSFDGESISACWVNDQRSAAVFVYLLDEGEEVVGFYDDLLAGTVPGTTTTYTFPDGASDTQTLAFKFIVYDPETGQGFTSEPIVGQFDIDCEPKSKSFFVRGLCAGVAGDAGNPQITDAIAVFEFLFLGSEPPPCRIACDSDGNGRLELTDGVRVLQFLFLGGDPPTNWIGSTPTCEAFVEGVEGFVLGCETPLAECVGAGEFPGM